MEIAGYPILNWVILIGILMIPGWLTGMFFIWLVTLRTDGREPDPTGWWSRHRWWFIIGFTIMYFVILGNVVRWKV